jgi:hypothetical protein
MSSPKHLLLTVEIMNHWPRIGMSTAIVAAFYIAATEFIQPSAFYQVYKWHSCAVLGGAGLVFLAVGFSINRRRFYQAKVNGAEYEGTFMLADLSFWGMVFFLCASAMILLLPTYRAHLVQARPLTNAVPATSSSPVPVKPIPVPTRREFPSLVLQGITYQGKNSSALINGKTFFVGEQVHGARIVDITPTTTTLEMEGETNVLELRK